jgi:hypothetical protein
MPQSAFIRKQQKPPVANSCLGERNRIRAAARGRFSRPDASYRMPRSAACITKGASEMGPVLSSLSKKYERTAEPSS